MHVTLLSLRFNKEDVKHIFPAVFVIYVPFTAVNV